MNARSCVGRRRCGSAQKPQRACLKRWNGSPIRRGLAAAGEWIVRADSGDELIARLTQLAEERDTR